MARPARSAIDSRALSPRAALFLAPALLACSGTLYVPAGDGGRDGSPVDSGGCDGGGCADADPCRDLVCGAGQRCVDGTCVRDDPCEDVVCSSPGEVCYPADGTCRPGATDDDRDGFTIAEGDCDDADDAVHPGAEEVCNGVDDDCDREVDELPARSCSTACGTGESRCVGGVWRCSVPETCECSPPGSRETEPCGRCGSRSRTCGSDWTWGAFSACDGEGDCSPGETGPCTTGCHSAGTARCGDDCLWGLCEPPAETCNGADDDCDGACDEGCRHRIHRCSSSASADHYYTPHEGLCESRGDVREPGGDFFLYTAAVPGAVDFWQCYHEGSTDHFYTASSSCEGSSYALEERIGSIGRTSFCGGVELFRMYGASATDHFYTTSPAEVTHAETLGYVLEGVAGFVWRD